MVSIIFINVVLTYSILKPSLKCVVDVRATIIQHQSARVGHANVGSVALPAVLRAGDASGQAQFSEGSLQKAQHSKLSSQMPTNGHVSPSVSPA